MLACDRSGLVPDLLVMGKGLGLDFPHEVLVEVSADT
jgi:4-aminobutyrate aminotransferase-like enzyme